jgi:glycosyltransferase involved in cell wall biosynthesis
MLLYITRKNAPSIGGMQRFNQKLVQHLKKRMEFRLFSWGRSQALMPVFLLSVFCRALVLGMRKKISLIYLADGLMSPLGVLLKTILKVKVVASIHGRDIAFSFPGYLKIIPRALRRLDRVICVSKQLEEECRRLGVPAEILSSIPNGVEIADFSWNDDRPPRDAAGLPVDLEGRTVLITVGRLVPKKGVNRFVRDILPALVAQAPDLLYLAVGDGPLKKEIAELVAAKGIGDNVLLVGDVPMDDVRLQALYNCADIFVMPNVLVPGDIEGFGIVALEAGAAGLPVVASRLQGIQEAVVPGENGILIRWDDTEDYIATLLDLIAHPEKRRELGKSARRFVAEHYAWETIAARYREAFTSVLKGPETT